ncbi:flagellar basal body-associated protein FliL [Geomicrobium halophilum]|uniref:Flagellar basal body-associated protein FliL n=1 Tax=Geomicrobium halophilum TaxID=549000 RepID=A0A841PQR9_9BACL|nr:flagellar basal body-associated protein FliL [Geomicrobium halophilum]
MNKEGKIIMAIVVVMAVVLCVGLIYTFLAGSAANG